MNYVFISPHFPPNYKYLAAALKEEGFRVLGIGPDPFEELDPLLQASLADYFQVPDMEDYGALLRAVGYLISRYGRIQTLESHNEHWLITDAHLRTDFNIPGYKIRDMTAIKRKSSMKKVFERHGIPTTRGILVQDGEEARAFARRVGYPLVAKPDIGVGASRTYKLADDRDLEDFLDNLPDEDYILEEFIDGVIQTFDGLTDREGKLIFKNSFTYADGVMEIVNEGLDTFYYTEKEIPRDLDAMGQTALEAFGVKERFFHFEFFRQKDGSLVALEVNVRPPGGQSLDMFNYANDMDIYRIYAAMRAGRKPIIPDRPFYHAAYLGVKHNRPLRHGPEEVTDRYGSLIQTQGPVPPIFSAAMGDYAYLLRSVELEAIMEAARFIRASDD